MTERVIIERHLNKGRERELAEILRELRAKAHKATRLSLWGNTTMHTG